MMIDWDFDLDRQESETDGRLAKICFPSKDGRFRITSRKLLPLGERLPYLVEDLKTGVTKEYETMADAIEAVAVMEAIG